MHLNWQRARRPIGILVLALTSIVCLWGCQKADVRYSATLDRAALMHLPFPSWQTADQGKVQQLDLSAAAPAKDKNKAATAPTLTEVTPIYVVRLDDTHAAMLTLALPVDDSNQPMNCHACPGTIGAYFFEHTDAGWRLTDRQDAVAQSGVEGNIGKTSVVKLAEGHYALSAEWGSCWQGYCGSWLVVVGLVPGKATLLSPGIALSAQNDGAYGACSALDGAQDASQQPGELHECFDVSGTWQYQGSRLLVSFDGRLSELDASGKLLPTKKIAQQAVYAIAPGRMTLQEGTNPVPHF